jgi:hypothetical protein
MSQRSDSTHSLSKRSQNSKKSTATGRLSKGKGAKDK